MGILQRMWNEVLKTEQAKRDKQRNDWVNAQIVALVNQSASMFTEKSELETLAERWVKLPEENLQPIQHYGFGPVSSYFGSSLPNQLQRATSAANQLVAAHQAAVGTVGRGGGQSSLSHLHPYSTGNYAGNNVQTVGSGGAGGNAGYVSTPTTPYPHLARSLGGYYKDSLYTALRGIEEAAMRNPKGNHKYDGKAVKLLDMRNFDEADPKVSLLSLCSFCTSNCYPPYPLVKLLQGIGIRVVTREV